MIRLGVNIDHVATVRQARRGDEPDPVAAARLCEDAGADGITAHLREDRRHIQDADIETLARTVRTVLNLEMACTEEMLGIATMLRPHQVTLVPEKRQEITKRLRELKPAVDEYNRLEAAASALAGVGGSGSKATTITRRRRPVLGSGARLC